mmetsp:Transcript_20141/g.51915  ORF Transcript_20141/g.51915 Transcript_20141/m.51915 type:complete len:250 (+) Transcript_20141:581-1330(+)
MRAQLDCEVELLLVRALHEREVEARVEHGAHERGGDDVREPRAPEEKVPTHGAHVERRPECPEWLPLSRRQEPVRFLCVLDAHTAADAHGVDEGKDEKECKWHDHWMLARAQQKPQHRARQLPRQPERGAALREQQLLAAQQLRQRLRGHKLDAHVPQVPADDGENACLHRLGDHLGQLRRRGVPRHADERRTGEHAHERRTYDHCREQLTRGVHLGLDRGGEESRELAEPRHHFVARRRDHWLLAPAA